MYALDQRHPADSSGKGAGRSSVQRLLVIASDKTQTSFHAERCLAFEHKLAPHLTMRRLSPLARRCCTTNAVNLCPKAVHAWKIHYQLSTTGSKRGNCALTASETRLGNHQYHLKPICCFSMGGTYRVYSLPKKENKMEGKHQPYIRRDRATAMAAYQAILSRLGNFAVPSSTTSCRS